MIGTDRARSRYDKLKGALIDSLPANCQGRCEAVARVAAEFRKAPQTAELYLDLI